MPFDNASATTYKAKAKATKAGKARAKPPVYKLITMRVTQEYADWLDGLADAHRSDVAKALDAGTAALARSIGYPEPPRRY